MDAAIALDAAIREDARVDADATSDAGVADVIADEDATPADANGDASSADANADASFDADATPDATAPADAAPPGDASPDTFGPAGFALGPSPGYAGGTDDRLLAAALDNQQRIVGAGYTKEANNQSRAVLVRYLSDGTADPTFGGGDGVVLGIGDAARESFTGTPDNDDRFSAIAIDAQDRILVAGKSSLGIGSGKLTVLARYTAAGDLDTAFGDLDGAGPARLGYVLGQGDAGNRRAFSGYNPSSARPEERFNALELDSQGRIIAVGLASEINADYYYRTLIGRFTADGELDASFNTGGFAIGNAGMNWQGFYDEFISVRVTTGDAIIAVGWTGFDSSFVDERTLIAKYTSTGALDPAFNATATPGFRMSGATSRAGGGKEVLYSVSIDAADQLVTAGFSFEPGDSYIHVLTERSTASGEADLSFGAGGYVVGARGEVTGANIEYLITSAIDTRGLIVVAGFTDEANNTIENNVDQAILLRYTASGALDTTISTWTNGTSELAGGTDDAFYAAVIAPGDEVYALGTSGGRALLVRYQANGCLDAPGPCSN